MSRNNPFSQQRIERLAYQFPDGGDWASNLQRLKQMKFRASVVGDFGTGKSTLVRELRVRLSSEGLVTRPITEPVQPKSIANRSIDESIRNVLLLNVPRVDRGCTESSCYRVTSRRQQRSSVAQRLSEMDAHTLLLVDGIERLTWFDRQWLVQKTASSSRVAGLIVIVHHRSNWLRLPVWIETRPTEDLLIELINDLVVDQSEKDRARIYQRGCELFKQHRHNIRATLRQLFDEWPLLD